MSLKEELDQLLNETEHVVGWNVDKEVLYHGAPAISVDIAFDDDRTLTCIFASSADIAMGGIEGKFRYDVANLVKSKVDAVLAGTAEEVQ